MVQILGEMGEYADQCVIQLYYTPHPKPRINVLTTLGFHSILYTSLVCVNEEGSGKNVEEVGQVSRKKIISSLR